MPLLRRMAVVLRAEEDLVADNILLQSQRLGEEARKLIDAQRRRQAKKVVERQWLVLVCFSNAVASGGSVGYSCCECSDGG